MTPREKPMWTTGTFFSSGCLDTMYIDLRTPTCCVRDLLPEFRSLFSFKRIFYIHTVFSIRCARRKKKFVDMILISRLGSSSFWEPGPGEGWHADHFGNLVISVRTNEQEKRKGYFSVKKKNTRKCAPEGVNSSKNYNIFPIVLLSGKR